MLICRKCQRRHGDGTRTCDCGADLRRDGIPIPEREPVVGTSELPRLEPLPALDDPAPVVAQPPRIARGADPERQRGADRPVPHAERRSRAGNRAAARGVEPGELAKRRASEPPPAPDASPTPAVVAERVAPGGASGSPDLRSARGRGATPDDLLADRGDPDRPNAHGADAPDLSDSDQPDAPRPPRDGEAACPRCLWPNADTRRFCQSCGETLPAFRNRLAGEVDDDQPIGVPRNTLWRRLTGTTVTPERDNRTWRQRARDAGHGRIRYQAGLSPKARLTMLAGGAGVVAAGALALGPYKDDLVALLPDPGGHSPIEASFRPLQPPEEGAEPVDPTLDGYAAELAIDGDEASAAGFELGTDGVPIGMVLELDLGEERTIDDVIVQVGLADGEETQLFPRPKDVELCTPTGACGTIEVADSAARQRIELSEPLTTQVLSVRVQAVHLSSPDFIRVAPLREIAVD